MNLLKKLKYTVYAVPALALAIMGVFTLTVSANATDNEDARPYAGLQISPATNSIELAAGQSYTGQMTVRNTSRNAISYEVSTGTYTIVDNNYDAPNYNKTGKYSLMKDWIKVSPARLDNVQPDETRTITYTIKVPSNPPAGTQYATVFASTVNNEKAKATGVQSTARAGMVIAANMKGGKTVDRVTIIDQSIPSYQPTSPLTSTFKVKNEGNIAASTTYSMKVTSWINGRLEYETREASAGVYPETTRTFDMQWKDSRIGIFKVEQSVRVNGRDYSTQKVVVAVPIWIIILIVLAIVCLVVFTVINIKAAREAKGGKAKSSTKTSKRRKA